VAHLIGELILTWSCA